MEINIFVNGITDKDKSVVEDRARKSFTRSLENLVDDNTYVKIRVIVVKDGHKVSATAWIDGSPVTCDLLISRPATGMHELCGTIDCVAAFLAERLRELKG